MMYAGMKVITSELCKQLVPVKPHAKKPWHRAEYHARISKKWLKKHGTRVQYNILIMNNKAFDMVSQIGWGSKTVMVHPEHLAVLRATGELHE